MIVDPHEGLEVAEVTIELAAGRMLTMVTNRKPPPVGSLLCNEDNQRLVFCASESPSVPSTALSPAYDTWVQIEARPAIALIHEALLKLVPDADGPVFKKVIYDQPSTVPTIVLRCDRSGTS